VCNFDHLRLLTGKTNALAYELYAAVTEVNGRAIPLAFLFTTSEKSAEEGAKELMLQDLVRFIYKRCPNVMFTLSDKDTVEINAFRTIIPNAKHQLCYWHAIRYLEERLKEDKAPAMYDPRKAHQIFDFIDPTFAPGVSSSWLEDGVHPSDAEVPNPRETDSSPKNLVKFRIKPLQTSSNANRPSEEAVLTPTVASTPPVPSSTSIPPAVDIPSTPVASQSVDSASKSDKTCLPPLLILKHGEKSIPVYPNPPAMKKADLPIFCPKEFQSTIVEMFRVHLHRHPEIPFNDYAGTKQSAKDIHQSCTYEMYVFCFKHDLSQVWAYLWNRWYTPNQWRLWARSADPAIPRLKTTMIVESLWRVLKHRDLHQFNRPRLDLVTHIITKLLLPRISQTVAFLKDRIRKGRPQALSSWQICMKRDWKDMSKVDEQRLVEKELAIWKKPATTQLQKERRAEKLAELEAERARSNGTYHTSLAKWTCSCPSYLISRHLLCKHLVRLVNGKLPGVESDLHFFANLRRCHFPPYYSIAGVNAPKDSDETTCRVAGNIQVLRLGTQERHQPRSDGRNIEATHDVPGTSALSGGNVPEMSSSHHDEDISIPEIIDNPSPQPDESATARREQEPRSELDNGENSEMHVRSTVFPTGIEA
jgi:hypothetical protein